MPTLPRFNTPTNITTQTSTQVKLGPGSLYSIVVNKTAAGTVGIFDGVSGHTTNTIGTLKSSIVEGTYIFDCAFSEGLYIVTGAASDITVNWAA